MPDALSPAATLAAIRDLIAEAEMAGWDHDDVDHPERAAKLERAQRAFAVLQIVMADADDTSDATDMAPLSEVRRAVDDGYLWPVARPAMVDGKAIRQRMVEDIAAAVRERTQDAVVSIDNLRRLGWTLDQIASHATMAFAIYKAEHGIKGRRGAVVRRDGAAAIAASALASLVLVACVALWAGLGTGVL